VKCPQCGQAISLPGAAETEVPASDGTEPSSLPLADWISDALAEPAPALPPTAQLQQTLSGGRLRRLTKRISAARKADAGRTVVDSATAALEELFQARDPRTAEVLAELFGELPLGLQSYALKLGAELGDPQLLPVVLPLLTSPTEPLLRGAVLCLGGLKDRRAVQPLLGVAVNQPAHRVRVITALSRLGDSGIPRLIEVLEPGAELSIQYVALEALGQLKHPRSIPAIARFLRDAPLTLRRHAAEQLALFSHPNAAAALSKCLRDPDEQLRLYAARGIMQSPSPHYAPLLVPLLTDASRELRIAGVQAIGACGDKRIAEALRTLLNTDDFELALAAAEALGRLGDDQSVLGLIERLEESGSQPEQHAATLQLIEALRRIGDVRATLPLLNLLGHCNPRVRTRAVEALGRLKAAEATGDLEALLRRDSIDEVRAAAAKALGELGRPAASKTLVTVGLCDVAAVRVQSLIALGRFKDRSVLEHMESLADDSSPQVRYHLAALLEELKDPVAIQALTKLACDGEEMVERAARRALAALGDTRGEKELRKAAQRLGVRPKSSSQATVAMLKPRRRSAFAQWMDFIRGATTSLLTVPVQIVGRLRLGGASHSESLPGGKASFAVAAVLLVAVGYVYSNRQSGPVTYSAAPPRGNVAALSAGSDGRLLAAGRTMRMIEVWDVTSKRLIDRVLNTPSQWIACSADGRSLIAADPNGATRHRLTAEGKVESSESLTGHSAVLSGLVCCESGEYAATVDIAGQVLLWPLGGGSKRQLAIASGPAEGRPSSFAISGDGKWLAAGYANGRVALWDTEAASLVAENKQLQMIVSALAFSPQGDQLVAAAGSQGSSLCVWDTKQLIAKPTVLDAKHTLTDRLAFRADGRLLAVSGSSATLVDLTNGTATAVEVRFAINALALANREQFAIGANDERTILIYGWDGKLLLECDETPAT
jgi:HEAT repeat protein/WD40 repeat protein